MKEKAPLWLNTISRLPIRAAVCSYADMPRRLEALMEMDVIACRAKHAAWLSGVRPIFRSSSHTEGLVHLPGNTQPPIMTSWLDVTAFI